MAIPVLHLNLVPPPTLWRQNHAPLGLAALLFGATALALAGGLSLQKYLQASREGRRIVSISAEAQRVAQEQTRLVDSLRQIDTAERLPRYRLAERIFLERALPWSRLTAEMERNLVQDVRLKSFQRIRSSDGNVTLKLRGEAKSRKAEAQFIEALQGNGTFLQVSLEREAERAGGGIDFDLALPVLPMPPAFEPIPVPPAQKVDQFGMPLQPGAKVLRALTGPAAASAAPLKPSAVSAVRPGPVPPAYSQGNSAQGNSNRGNSNRGNSNQGNSNQGNSNQGNSNQGNSNQGRPGPDAPPAAVNPRPLQERAPILNRNRERIRPDSQDPPPSDPRVRRGGQGDTP